MKIFRRIASFLAIIVCVLGIGCGGGNTNEFTVYAPDGAPALALAKAMSEDTESDGVSYRVVSASTIGAYVSYEESKDELNADACILPVNLASKLLGNGEKYQLVGVVTHGNLYLMSEENVAVESAETLIGKTVRIAQLANVPGIMMKMILSDGGIPYQTLSDGNAASADKVNLTASGVADFRVVDCLQAASESGYIVGDLQALYGGNGYPQAVLVAKKSAIGSEKLNLLVEDIEDVGEYFAAATAKEISAAVQAHMHEGTQTKIIEGILDEEMIARCSVRFEYAAACRTEVDGILSKMIAIAPNAAAVASEDFYYLG